VKGEELRRFNPLACQAYGQRDGVGEGQNGPKRLGFNRKFCNFRTLVEELPGGCRAGGY
jgi:hypothetical protein